MNPTCLKFVIEAMFMVWLIMILQIANAGVGEGRCIEKERQALLRFKAGVVDENGMLSSWREDNRDCCRWKGVSCTGSGHIQRLDLAADFDEQWFLRGNISISLEELHQLRYLNLNSNYFDDSNMPHFFVSLINLRYLDLSSCNLGGKIPSNQFGFLSNLKYLNLAGNSLVGSIPHELGNLSKLQYLDLGRNTLEGTIPFQLGNLSSLQELSLRDNGDLKIDVGSQWLSSLTSLTHLDLSGMPNLDNSHNWIQTIGNMSKLRVLRLSECDFSDQFVLSSSITISKFNFSNSISVLDLSFNTFTSYKIFSWVSNVTPKLVDLDLSVNNLRGSTNMSGHFVLVMNSLKRLDLSSNGFQGRDLKSIMTTSNHSGIIMNSLEQLDLHSNELNGEDLKSFMNICSLRSLNMEQNNLTQDLASILGNLSLGCIRYSLQELDFSQNSITGTLSDLSKFLSLKRLDLSNNQLSGKIPEDAKLPPHLEYLSMESNSLEGSIPTSLFGNTCNLSSLKLDYNKLSEDLSVIIHHLSGCARYSLQELYLGSNNIKGTLSDLSMFSTLTTLDLSGNQLNGKIPEESRLPSQLEVLNIASNFLEGGIPKSFGNTCNLGSFDMSSNNLNEELPVIIQHLSGCTRYSLQELVLEKNQIHGSLPDFSIFPSLQQLFLGENKLNGTIPGYIQFPSQLNSLDLRSNHLKGVITDSHLANMSKLKTLDLSGNSATLAFSQHWIPSFQLEDIALSSCQLGPAFPKWLQTQNKLNSLDISSAGISDTVPNWFWAKLESETLASANIASNNLKGTIPDLPIKGCNCFLYLSSNHFEGPVPPFLRGVASLDLSRNKFSDSQSFVCNNGTADTLTELNLSHNQLSGLIPDCWSRFKSLAYLDLSYNNFSGKVPTSIGSLGVQALRLRNNSLSEGIPSSMKNCTYLEILDMGENQLSGHIPSWIGSTLKDLQMISLQRNRFSGSFPSQLCYLTGIQLLDLSSNNLSGQIPKCIKNFTLMAQETPQSVESYSHMHTITIGSEITKHYFDAFVFMMWKGNQQLLVDGEFFLLKGIDLSSNQFSGEIPAEIENLLELVWLNLSRNNLTGEIPSNIGRLTSLEFLDLSRNQLSGEIPSSLTHIDRLAMLDLSHNHLAGVIPTSTQLQSFNASSYEDNLDLCGPPLPKVCKEVVKPPLPPPQEVEDVSVLSLGFYISMALGFATGFWGIFGSMLVSRRWRHAYFRFLNTLMDNIYVTVAVKFVKFKRRIRGLQS